MKLPTCQLTMVHFYQEKLTLSNKYGKGLVLKSVKVRQQLHTMALWGSKNLIFSHAKLKPLVCGHLNLGMHIQLHSSGNIGLVPGHTTSCGSVMLKNG